MRKFSYLFAAILMSVLSLTGKAATTTEDFSGFTSADYFLHCTEGWYYNGAQGGALTTNATWPAGTTGVFFGTYNVNYLVTEAKAGKVSIQVGISSPVAAAASNANISVNLMSPRGGDIANGFTQESVIKEWKYGNGLSEDALLKFVTLEFDLDEDCYIGFTGNSVCLHEYTNTYEGGGNEGEGGGDWVVAESQDFNSVQSGHVNATGCSAKAGWPEGWFYLLNGNAGYKLQQDTAGVDGTACIKFNNNGSAPTVDKATTDACVLITSAKKGQVVVQIKANSSVYANNDARAYIVLYKMNQEGNTFTIGEQIQAYATLNAANPAISATNFVPVTFEIPEDCYIGFVGANFMLDNFENLIQSGGGGAATTVTDVETFNTITQNRTGSNDMTQANGWPEGWYVTGGCASITTQTYGGVDDSPCILTYTANAPTHALNNCYVVTYVHKGKVTIDVKAYSASAATSTNNFFRIKKMTKADDTFTPGEIIGSDICPISNAGINADGFTTLEWDIPEDMWIGISCAGARFDNVANTYEVAGGNFTVSGTVKNEAGEAVVGATVTLTGCEATTTAEDGSYSFVTPISGSASLKVTAPGYVNYSEDIDINSDMVKDVVLELQTSTLKIWLSTTTNDTRITTAKFTLFEGETETPVAGCENVTADEEGYYNFTVKGQLNPANYTLKGTATGYEDKVQTIYSVETYNGVSFNLGKTATGHIYLTNKTVRFTATVVNSDLEYLNNATVTLSYGETTRTATYVEDNQNYVITSLPAPELAGNTVVANCVVPGMKPIAPQTIEFDGGNINVNFMAIAYENTIVKGNITRSDDENAPVANATVALFDGENKVAEVTSNDEGAYTFTLTGAAAESYTLTATAPYFEEYTAEVTPNAEASKTVNFEMTPVMYTFTATVADKDEVAIPGAKVTLDGTELKTAENGNFVASIWAGDAADGATFTVVASAEGYAPETYELSFAEGEVEKSYAFTLSLQEYSFTVTVIDDFSFEPLADAIVKIADEKGNEQTVVNEGNGKFAAYWTSKTLPEGELTATISYPDYESQVITFDFTEQTAISEQVTLEQIIRTLTVTVLDSNNNDAPVLNARVNITVAGMDDFSEDAEPMGDGSYVFAAGAAAVKGLTMTATVIVPDAEPESFDFTLDEGNVEKTVKVLVSGVDAIFAGEQGAKNLAGKIYVNGDAQIFTIDGKLVRVVRTQSAQEVEGLQPGLYIVAGQKMIVK
ncbi:MAG: hypothetical protein HDS66_07485 [Bacteroidales bacterium]|nr:hypothetical protein [Bacteroidales bacterium]